MRQFWGGDAERDGSWLELLEKAAKIDVTKVMWGRCGGDLEDADCGAEPLQQLMRLDIESRDAAPAEMRWLEEAGGGAVLGKVHAVILSDYAKGALTEAVCAAVIRAARVAGVPVLVDPKSLTSASTQGRLQFVPIPESFSLATGIAAHRTEEMLVGAQALLAEPGV